MPDITSLPTADRLLGLIERMAGQPLLMLVDLVADRFITGTPKRISREAPVLILRYEGETLAPGGGANAVANVASLGGLPLVVGAVGADAAGEALVSNLGGLGIDVSGIVRRRAYRTPTKTRILGGGRHSIKQQIVRYDLEDPRELDAGERRELAEALRRFAGRARVGVMSDYGYGAVEPGLLGAVRTALEGSGTVLCDSRHRLGEFAGLDGATPNEEEAEALLGGPLAEEDGRLAAAVRAALERLGGRFLLLTRGSRGMTLVERGALAEVPVHGTDQVADVTGAGDTVIGTLALALAAGANPLEATLLANYAGGVVVMKTGTATLTAEELRHAVAADPRPLEELRWVAS